MSNKSNSNIIEELVDIIDNPKTSLKEKKKLLKIKLNNIYSILNAFPSKESNTKLRKIKILIKNIDNIKNYTELKKIFNLNLLYNLLDFDNKSTTKSADNLDLIKSENSKDYNKKLNINISEDNKDNEDESEEYESEDVSEEDVSDEGSYENDTDDDSDDYSDDYTDDENDLDENNSYDNSDDGNINYLINKLPNKEKVKLLLKLAKLKNDHTHKMQLEMNKHKEIMYDKKIKELKIKSKYNLEKTRLKK